MITYSMSWEIEFFSEKVSKDTLKFPKDILADLLKIFEMIEDLGPNLGYPYTTPMGKGLFEIRAKGKEGIGRSLFCTIKNQKVMILHSFIKKTQKTPKQDLDLARKRMKEV
jgi:phage-related protein